MKKYVIAICIALSFTSFGNLLNAQTKSSEKEDLVKSQKIAFFTEKLSLTPEEAQRFWPVYNSYWERKNQIIEERKKAMKFAADNMEKLSPKEIERYGDMYINFHKQESDLLVEYNKKFKEVLPPEKVMKLYQADYRSEERRVGKEC